MAYELPQLAYSNNALEPHVDGRTMEIHHTKHHQAYITNLNKALEQEGITPPENVLELFRDLSKMPESIRGAVRNNGGGHWNHSFFWNIIAPDAGGEPVGQVKGAIDQAFGSFAQFQEKFT